ESIQFNYKIQVNSAVDFRKKELPIHPYLLGVLIGDGGLTNTSIRFTTIDNEIIEKLKKIIKNDYNDLTIKQVSNTITYSITTGNVGVRNVLNQSLINLKLKVKSNKKFIP